jgi:hypothetical protein
MGTQAKYGFIDYDCDKISYCHYDGYPRHLGLKIVEFIKRHTIDELKEISSSLRLVTSNIKVTNDDVEQYKSLADPTTRDPIKVDWYWLLRRCQGNMDYHKKYKIMLLTMKHFDVTWTYIINLKTNRFEIYNYSEPVCSLRITNKGLATSRGGIW